MDTTTVVDLGQQALWMAVLISAPLLVVALVVGLIIGVLQAATSINESSVAFIPKLIVIAVVLLIVGPSSLAVFVDYLREVISDFPALLR
mgnify:FL=1